MLGFQFMLENVMYTHTLNNYIFAGEGNEKTRFQTLRQFEKSYIMQQLFSGPISSAEFPAKLDKNL